MLKIWVIVCLFCSGQLFAQSDFLVVSKYGSKKRRYYQINDYIQVKPKLDFATRKGILHAFSDSALYFSQDDSMLFSNIDYIYLGKKSGVFPKGLALANFISTTVPFLMLYGGQLGVRPMTLEVKGGLIVISVTGITPIVVNSTYKLFTQNKLFIAPDAWQIHAVIMNKKTE